MMLMCKMLLKDLVDNDAHEKVTRMKADTQEAETTGNSEKRTTKDYEIMSEFGSQKEMVMCLYSRTQAFKGSRKHCSSTTHLILLHKVHQTVIQLSNCLYFRLLYYLTPCLLPLVPHFTFFQFPFPPSIAAIANFMESKMAIFCLSCPSVYILSTNLLRDHIQRSAGIHAHI